MPELTHREVLFIS